MMTLKASGISGKGFTDNDAQNVFARGNNNGVVSGTCVKGRAGGSYQTVLFKPLSGILNQMNYLPIRFVPITIDLSLVDDAADIIILIVVL